MKDPWSLVRAGFFLAVGLVLATWLLGDEIAPLLLALRDVALVGLGVIVAITVMLMFRRP